MASNLPGSGVPAGGRGDPPAIAPEAYRRRWLTLMVVVTGTFMATLDASIVNISLPAITRTLGANLATVQWVVTVYVLVITALLLCIGRLADIIGRKPVYSTGIVVFTVASGLCGAAQSIEQLIFLRAVQGAGAAAVMAVAHAITASVFPPGQRGKALGLNTAAVATGLSTGPVLGGLLIGLMDWRAVFFARVPVGLVATALTLLVLREPSLPRRKQRFDLVGAALLTLGLTSLLLGLNQGQQGSWTSPSTVGLLAASGVLLAVFLAAEGRVSQPVLDPSLFRNRIFAAANASAILSFVASSGVVFLMPFFLMGILGFDSARAGLIMTASPVTTVVVGPISGLLSDRLGSRGLSSLGLLVCCGALLLLSGLQPGASALDVAVPLAILGFGSGLFGSPNNNAIFGSVSRERLGVAAGMIASMRNLGIALGVALAGAVYSTRYAHYLAGPGAGAPAFPPEVGASVAAFHETYLVAAAFAAIGIFTSLVRGQDRPRKRAWPAPAPARTED